MKRVEAEIPAIHLTGVKERLQLIGVSGMTVTPCAAAGCCNEVYRGVVLRTPQADLVRVDVAVTDDMADSVVRAVIAVVRRDETADGRISVAPIDDVLRISTGQTGPEAL